ncbi:FAD-dependent oxidoreductase [Shewanella sp. 1_MG-2023]|uniref:FAD-dependent oxidoreductase n=1 Tax=unclassified Shewanella TaxID=196818 RepID=UPI0026E435B8|nr:MULTISPECIES: FAD-dependent oxidoreductase [unclassified Shewanella]MDO6611923.1 FAD-dependent oxidoreductase [Shewanella sp. 7_MG-2023]MDO6771778.1 FAD-dependent oxidoreductase [Shewanella sp. 2_MG-2023]MDO6794004.1 FAD-dependent oxidoreductase [Shewanella sp. 1_MG-2023]
MKRRSFFKAAALASVFPASASQMAIGIGSADKNKNSNTNTPLSDGSKSQFNQQDRTKDKWLNLGTNNNTDLNRPSRNVSLSADIVVIGGGAAGICAAVSAARLGSKVVLVQDRPVLGGNASSEMRVHLNGVNRLNSGLAERETGIIEEILLHNRFENPQESFPVWDHVLYDFVIREPNIELMLNTQAIASIVKDNQIQQVRCWQLTTETEYLISAQYFIDCSGDGLMAATAGAEYRTGREGKSEFNEQFAPDVADGWQMGASLLMSAKDMGRETPYTAPSWAIKFDAKNAHKRRKFAAYDEGIWWVEVGSEYDIVGEQEINRHKLMGYLHGVWDHIKNSGQFPESANLALDWVGSLPSRRESRRFIGDYIHNERDLIELRHFEDAVAFGGWGIDEHNPGGMDNIHMAPTIFHAHFDEVYQIPFRSLYSRTITNLLFAGRNISQTHIALASSRIMATCALMGQAVGTAANLCQKLNVSPRQLGKSHINELQEQLLRDDVFIPKRPAKAPNDLARKSTLFASSTLSGDISLLLNGISRDIDNKINHWQSRHLPANIQLEWPKPVGISTVEIKCDTNVKRNIMMRKDSKNDQYFSNSVPDEMVKDLKLQARVKGQWIDVASIKQNRTRLIKVNFPSVNATALKLEILSTYGKPTVKLFEIRAYS